MMIYEMLTFCVFFFFFLFFFYYYLCNRTIIVFYTTFYNNIRFGSGKFMAPKYAIATGKEECDVCKHMMNAKRGEKEVDFESGGEAAGGEAAIPAGVPKG
jgi:hypothetical protein